MPDREHPDSLVAHLLSSGLIDEEDVPLVLALRREVRAAPGVPLSDHDVLGVAQSLGRGVERVAAAVADVAIRELATLPEAERDAALTVWLDAVLPIASRTFELLCDHRTRQIARRRLETAVRVRDLSPPLAVAFVDLRGSTLFMLDHPPQEIEALGDELYATGQTVAAEHDVAAGKFLGDGVLLLSADADRMVTATRALVAALGERTPLRAGAGVAYGPVIRRAGDWHGPPVNLAARLGELATADEVLVDPSVVAAGGVADPVWRTVLPRGLPGGRQVAVFGPAG